MNTETSQSGTLTIDHDLPPLTARGGILDPEETGHIAESLRLLETARAKAAEIEANTSAAFEAEKKRGYQEGQAAAATEATKHHLRTVLSTISYLESLEGQLADSVTSCLRNLVRDLPSSERVVQLAGKALQGIHEQNQIILKVHPDDQGPVVLRLTDLRHELADVVRFEVRGDHTLTPGDCILETPSGVVNASLENQLAILSRELTRER